MPEPETPVKTTILPSGMSTFIFFKLFKCAFFILKNLPLPSRTFSGIGMYLSPLKYLPVIDSGAFIISCIEPDAIILPPKTPALGPISTI